MNQKEKLGKLMGVGVGPGDPELLTLKAVRMLREADVLFLPVAKRERCIAYEIARGGVDGLDEKPWIGMDFPMTKEKTELENAFSHISSRIKEELEEGKLVCFLTIGDPTIYSTFVYVAERIEKEGYEVEYVSGVPSFAAACGKLGISMGERQEQIHIIPGSYDVCESVKLSGTKIYMKSGKKLKELLVVLEKEAERRQKEKEEPWLIYGVSNCGMANEECYHGIEALKKADAYLTVVIVKGN